jgi:hypothetical protein
MNLRTIFKMTPGAKTPVPAAARALHSGGREISETEYLALCASDDYNGAQLTQFRVARALRYAASGDIVTPEPGILMLATAVGMFQRPVTVLEFGGGTGYHATTLSRLLPGLVSRYVVVETAAQVAAANGKIAGVQFLDRIPDENFDIVFSSGALQCTQAPLGYLKQLCDLAAPVMVFARNAFSDRQVFFEQRSSMLNHGAGPVPDGFEDLITTLYVQTLKETDFLNLIGNRYARCAKLPNGSGIVEGCEAYGFDYLFKRVST